MDINTGKGVRTVAAPKTGKSGKYGTKRVPIISNNVDKYIRAVQLAYGADGEAAYAQDIQVVKQALGNVGIQPMIMNQPTKVPSPKVTGATLAPIPTFMPAQATQVPKIFSPKVTNMGGTQFPTIPALGGLFGKQQ